MEDWVKFNSYGKAYEAELLKNVLHKNDIKAVVYNAQDSMFLWGELDLYVEKNKLELAKKVILEFDGLDQIGSAIKRRCLDNLAELLEEAGVHTQIYQRPVGESGLHEYVLYVNSEDGGIAREFVKHLAGWNKVASFSKQLQAAYRVEKLEQNRIESIVLDSSENDNEPYEISLYVKRENTQGAKFLINSFEEWSLIDTFDTLQEAEVTSSMLHRKLIDVLENPIKNAQGHTRAIEIYTLKDRAEAAHAILAQASEWSIFRIFKHANEAFYVKEVLADNGVESFIVNSIDSLFLIGDVKLYVEDRLMNKALDIVSELDLSVPASEAIDNENMT